MRGDKGDQIERWFRQGLNGKFPGKCAVFVGAGISIDGPTQLPSGEELTRVILHHMLDATAAAEILNVFDQCEAIIRRRLPRLEHVLDKTCNPLDGERIARAGNPRNILQLFANREPNDNHRRIANFLIAHRGWAITTNFDDCIERASNFKIPVHVINSAQTDVVNLHPEFGDSWGLIKLHGTITNGVDTLAATLADLQLGMPSPVQRLLDRVMSEVDVMVVAGYSGTDHFDVNHWIRNRGNSKEPAPRLIWISHSTVDDQDPIFDKKAEPNNSWTMAFKGTFTKSGVTSNILAELLDQKNHTFQSPTAEPLSDSTLAEELQRIYLPTKAEKHLSGARLAISIGLGQRAEEELRQCKQYSRLEDEIFSIDPDMYFARGMGREALEIRTLLDRAGVPIDAVTQAKLLRHQGKMFSSAWRLVRLRWIPNDYAKSSRLAESIDLFGSIFDVIEQLQCRAIFRGKIVRKLFSSCITSHWRKAIRTQGGTSIALKGKIQTQGLRLSALLDDVDEEDTLAHFWRMVHDQYSPANFYTPNGPLIPSFHLLEQRTAIEEDRLADFVQINLELASILLVVIRRRWPNGVDDAWREMRGKRYHDMSADFRVGQMCAATFVNLLTDAQRVATALQEHGLNIAVAKCWLKAERIFGGISYWKSQRLYLAPFMPEI